MNKKKGRLFEGLSFAIISILLILLFALPASISQNESDAEEDSEATTTAAEEETASASEESGFSKAYTCLENSVKERGYDDLTVEEQAFAMLALAYDGGIQGELRSALSDSSHENLCWPSDGGCTVKQTALALLALNHVNQATNEIENWLLDEDQTIAPRDLVWYLQIDASEATECKIKHGDGSRTIKISEAKKVTGAGGECFSTAFNGYWLEVDSDCYDEEFEISCDKAFVSSLVYKRRGSAATSPYYISSISHSAVAESSTKETVNSLCFKQEDSTSCDYEGTLWATTALKKMGKDTSAFLPYLIALSSSNEKFFPSSFLYMLSADDEYFQDIINKQKTGGYWQITSDTKTRYYDTSLGLLALSGKSAEQSEKAIDYILETQQGSGCWNNVRDTAFVLYAASPRTPSVSDRVDCEDSGYFCVSKGDVCEDALGKIMSGYYCSGLKPAICCSKEVDEEIEDIEKEEDEDELSNECEETGYYCKSFCDADVEDEKAYSCSGVESCCAPKSDAAEERNYWWVWLLIFLIVLLVLAIIYRNQLKIWIFRIKNKFSKGPVGPQTMPPRPGFPPAPPMFPRAPGLMPRRILPGQRQAMPQQPGFKRLAAVPARPGAKPYPRENILQDTLKKLKEIGR